jgi:hypothetical protein
VSEHESLRRGFLIGVLGAVIAFVLVGGLISALGTTDDRPEGVAERWLTSVGDTTRDGVQDDADERVAAHGDPRLVDVLIPSGVDMDGKAAFTELEVGKAVKRDGAVLGPYRVALREGTTPAADGTLVMTEDAKDGWQVRELGPSVPGAAVPSKGGGAVSKAPVVLYVVALGIGVLVTMACSALVRAADPRAASSRPEVASRP